MSNKIGFHARSIDEFMRLVRIPHVDVLELKPEKCETGLYTGDGLDYELNHTLLKSLSRVAAENDVTIQFHMPPDHWDSHVKENLSHSFRKDHKYLLARFSAYLDMYEHYGLGTSITMHPPLFQKDGEELCNIHYAIDKANKCYKKYANLLSERDLDVTVGLENMLPPKTIGSNHVGFLSYHFNELLSKNPFGLVYDTGHARLAENFDISDFTRHRNVHTIHLHTNDGTFMPDTYKDDSHQLATPFTLPSFDEAIHIAKRDNATVICEVKNLSDYSDELLNHYLWHLSAALRK